MTTTEPMVLPHSLLAETAILGGLMTDNDAIDRIGDLAAAAFYRHDHRIIFEAIRALLLMQRTADVVTVFDRLQACGSAQDAGGMAYLNDLVVGSLGTSNIARYADIVREKALLRGLLVAADRVQDIVTGESGKSAAEMLDAAQAEFGKLAESTTKSEPASIQDAMTRYIDDLDERFHGAAPHRGIPTGLADLDELLNGGMRRGSLITVGARPGMGKSAFAETIACNVADAKYSVLFLSMEMPEAEVVERAVAGWGKIAATSLAAPKAKLTADDWPRITNAVMTASNVTMFVDDQPGLTLLDVVTKARGIKRKHGLDFLVVDYLQLMSGAEEKRYQQIETITKGLKALAKTLNIVVFSLSQFSRDIEKRPNPRPKPSDFRDGGSIEQDSDVLIGLYREEQDNPDSEWKGCAEAFLMKNRQGKTGKTVLTYLGEYMRFENFTGSMQSFQNRAPAGRRSRGFDE